MQTKGQSEGTLNFDELYTYTMLLHVNVTKLVFKRIFMSTRVLWPKESAPLVFASSERSDKIVDTWPFKDCDSVREKWTSTWFRASVGTGTFEHAESCAKTKSTAKLLRPFAAHVYHQRRFFPLRVRLSKRRLARTICTSKPSSSSAKQNMNYRFPNRYSKVLHCFSALVKYIAFTHGHVANSRKHFEMITVQITTFCGYSWNSLLLDSNHFPLSTENSNHVEYSAR